MPKNIAGVCRLFYALIDDSKLIGVHCFENRFDRGMLDFSLVRDCINLLSNLGHGAHRHHTELFENIGSQH